MKRLPYPLDVSVLLAELQHYSAKPCPHMFDVSEAHRNRLL